jgi:hypothetical protein
MSDGILCGTKGSRTVVEARHEMEWRSRIQISNSQNIGFRFCKGSGDLEKCERKHYILVRSPVIQCSTMQRSVALSVMEAELFAATNNVQDMLYKKRIIESLGLHVQLPMILEVDNKGAVDLVNNYSVGGWTLHVETRQFFMRQLKEENIIKVIWTPGELNSSDLYTKNLAQADFEKQTKAYVGDYTYMRG